MIQYPIPIQELAQIVCRKLGTRRNKDGTFRKNGRISWRLRASTQAQQLRELGGYAVEANDEIWHELNTIFAKIQGGKCAYCETLLEDRKSGRVIGDIEHYRPKRGVEVWPTRLPIPPGSGDQACYYRLAFSLRNYLLACEICNQDYKRNYFPIAGPRCPADTKRSRYLKAERPYLLHPLDPHDADPEDLIEFIGIVPTPRNAFGTEKYWRAAVTIELLGLSNGNRFKLDYDRALVICNLYQALIAGDQTDPVVVKTLNDLNDNTIPHRNCARSFKRLFDTNPGIARQRVQEALKFVDSYQKRKKS